ncbi:MAG: hypothetical protein HY078_08920 [Elusimicrobia bacterium]|nr:hypothetical protein [Elusimicrobiota bacterium]
MRLFRALYIFDRALPAAAAAALLCACSTANVTVKQGYDFSKIKRVAVMGFKDYSRWEGSGVAVSSVFEKYLLDAGYDVIERRDAAKLLKEQSFSVSGAVDPKTAKQIGRILGVDALIFGAITGYSAERQETSMVDRVEERQEPIIQRVQETVKQGDQVTTVERDVITGYRTVRNRHREPQTRTIMASVGLAVRMVDINTGEVLWVGSNTGEGYSTGDAADAASSGIFKALKKAWKPK